jgi:type VI secretion system protein VasG
MSEISRVSLFGKLNPTLYKAVESATVFCKLRGNPYVELVHWLHQVLNLTDSDVHRIIRHFELDTSKLATDFQRALDTLPRGATAISDLSSHIENAVERAWVYATLMYGESQVRSGYIVIGLIKTNGLRNVLVGISKEFEKISNEELSAELRGIIGGSPEEAEAASDASSLGGEPGEASGALTPNSKQEALKKFAVNLTARARAGELDPVSGRDEEIRQIVDILMRRRQNNPLLAGEAGVGKTAVAEGFALRIARGDVPPQLKDVDVYTLDIGLLQAGASMKGEFEQRLRSLIDEVQASPKPIILFIDEVHTLIGAGGASGTGDAANLLKPALARGTLRTIGATTWSEYKKYIEKDPALTRRFQVIQVAEPDEAEAIIMLRGVVHALEKHHQVQILDEAIDAAVRLSHRYIPARQLPDKAVSLLDTSCARVAVSQFATPPHVEDCQRRIEALNTELEIIDREAAIGIDVTTRKIKAQSQLAIEEETLSKFQAQWAAETDLVQKILALRKSLRTLGNGSIEAANGAPGTQAPSSNSDTTVALTPEEIETRRTEQIETLRRLQNELAKLQGDRPLVLPSVDQQAVGSVVADWTGIPVGRMVKNEIEAVLKITDTLNLRVVGQRHGLEVIAKRVQTSSARLDNPNKPIGVFLLCGPSGVGKTETALALAEALYGGEQNIITINMSEFQEAHTVSTLKGAPPGYVGYGEGGVLTEAVRRRPYSVVLLDEIEKAHSDVHEIFFQVFDKGWMEDGEGRYIDFKNTIIILTSNVGTDTIATLCRDPELMPATEAITKALREPLLKVFPPALLGRVITVPYLPLSDTVLASIVELQLKRIQKRVRENHEASFEYDETAVRLVIDRCTETESGGRMIDAILTNTVLPRISAEYLQRIVSGEPLKSIKIAAANGEFSYEFT